MKKKKREVQEVQHTLKSQLCSRYGSPKENMGIITEDIGIYILMIQITS
jgi:hypothetical protein